MGSQGPRNYEVFDKALQLIRKILLGMANAQIIALEILYSLEHTQIVLLSFAAKVSRHNSSALANCPKYRDWTEKEQVALVANLLALYLGHEIGEIY